MEYRIFQTQLQDAHRVTKYCLTLCGAQFVMILLLVILSISLSHRSQTTLIPMNLNAPITVSNNSVSSDYLDQVALSFINLRLNFDPESVSKNHQIILRFVSSHSYQAIQKSLTSEAQWIKAQGISSNFYVNKVSINRSQLSVKVAGKLIRSVGDKELPPVNTQFLISFKNNNGLLAIDQFVEEKNDAK